MRVWGKESHLTLRIAPIGAMRILLNQFPDSKAICGFLGGNIDVLAHKLPSFFNRL
jgi:hypothetical protein